MPVSKSDGPNYPFIQVIHEAITGLRLEAGSPSLIPQLTKAVPWHPSAMCLVLEFMPGVLMCEYPPPPFSFIFYRFCCQDIALGKYLVWQVPMTTGDSTWREAFGKHSWWLWDRGKANHSGWISRGKPSRSFVGARAGGRGWCLEPQGGRWNDMCPFEVTYGHLWPEINGPQILMQQR